MKCLILVVLLAACSTADKLPHADGAADHGHADHGHATDHAHAADHGQAAESSYSEPPAAAPVHAAPVHAAPVAAPASSYAAAPVHAAAPASSYAADPQQGYYYYYYPTVEDTHKDKGGLLESIGPYGNIIIISLVVIGMLLILASLMTVENGRTFDWISSSISSVDIPYNEMMNIAQRVYTAIQKEY